MSPGAGVGEFLYEITNICMWRLTNLQKSLQHLQIGENVKVKDFE